MPPKKKQRFSSLQQQKQAIQDFLDNISDDEETPFDNDISFEASDDKEEIPVVSESESEGEEGDEEYEQLPRKQLFKTIDECCDETNYQHLEVQAEENKSYTYTSVDKAAKTPVEGFDFFITGEMMQDVVNNTNKNIRNFMTPFHDVLKESSKYTYVKRN